MSQRATSQEATGWFHDFDWFPKEKIFGSWEAELLREHALRNGGDGCTNLYLILAGSDIAPPGARKLADIIRTAYAAARRQRLGTAGEDESRSEG